MYTHQLHVHEHLLYRAAQLLHNYYLKYKFQSWIPIILTNLGTCPKSSNYSTKSIPKTTTLKSGFTECKTVQHTLQLNCHSRPLTHTPQFPPPPYVVSEVTIRSDISKCGLSRGSPSFLLATLTNRAKI